jgi:hypothetical protein
VYTNPNVYDKLAKYIAVGLERHGLTFNPTTDPLDTDLVMRVGRGKQHDRYFIANSTIEPSYVQTLSQIRRGDSKRDGSQIPIAPRQPSSSQMMAAF